MNGLSDQEIKLIKKNYPKGTRLVCKEMFDPQPVPAGTKGTVDSVDDSGQIHVNWDNGSTLALIPFYDEFKTLEEIEAAEGKK